MIAQQPLQLTLQRGLISLFTIGKSPYMHINRYSRSIIDIDHSSFSLRIRSCHLKLTVFYCSHIGDAIQPHLRRADALRQF